MTNYQMINADLWAASWARQVSGQHDLQVFRADIKSDVVPTSVDAVRLLLRVLLKAQEERCQQ